jgi:tRNA(Ile)-lysidine synthase
MSTLIDRARRTIRRYGLLPGDARVVVALSGGADSVALLHVMKEMASADGFELCGAAHLNHRLRGEEADRDERFCAQLAAGLGLRFDAESVDVSRRADETGTSIEQAAHLERHEFFNRAAIRLEADVVAIAHTRDDQAETFLLRVLRGAGPRGLSGIHPRSGFVIRPFIDTPRSEVRDFLASRGLAFCEDSTNADVSIPRNRIRHDLIPYLESRFSPGIADVLARNAAIARDDADFLDAEAARAAAAVLARVDNGVQIDCAGLLALPAAVAHRVVREAQQMANGGRFVGFEAVEAVMAFAVSNQMGPLDLPGHRVNRRGGHIVLLKSRGRGGRDSHHLGTPEFRYELGVPGMVTVPQARCAIGAASEDVPAGESAVGRWLLVSRGNQVVVEADRLERPLVVRNRHPGDSFRPLGLRGHKKLQDFFVDLKIERSERDTIPLVVDSRGQIVWVAGHAVSEDFRVTDRTKAVIILNRVPV